MKFKGNHTNRGDGLQMMECLEAESVNCVFFDPQYRTIIDRMSYGNTLRMTKRLSLSQMKDHEIRTFSHQILRILKPSGHMFFWADKYNLMSGNMPNMLTQLLLPVDLITWQKRRMGMGYRTRRKCEYLGVYQKPPLRAKGKWRDRGIPDVWTADMEKDHLTIYDCEFMKTNPHPHSKPIGLQRRLIECVTRKGHLVVDPCAGSYSVMMASMSCGRRYLGCDVS